MATRTEEQEAKIDELAKSTDENYARLLSEQAQLQRKLSWALNSDKKNIGYIKELENQINDINNVISSEREYFAKFHDAIVSRAGGIKGLNDQMLKDVANYEKIFVETYQQIGKLNETLKSENDKIKRLDAKYTDGRGNLRTTLTTEQRAQYQKDKTQAEQSVKELTDAIQAQLDFRHNTYQGLEDRYGKGSYATNEADRFAKSKKDQIALAQRLALSQQTNIDKEKELREAYDEGNAALAKREKIAKTIQDAWNGAINIAKKSAEYWENYNAQAVGDAKRLGIFSRESAHAYQVSLMESSKQLSRNFGMSYQEAMKMQTMYSSVTGRATKLSQSQIEDVAAASQLMGKENVQQAIKMMDTVGASSEQAIELMDKNYIEAARMGLDTTKASEALVSNLSLANKFSFRNGTEGIQKMTLLSQKVKMNFQEVANVAEKFSTIEGAIQGSAQLQMLGGSAAMYGSNPMQMLYEATSDPEALYKRMVNMASNQAYFDKKKGEAVIDPMQMALMREQAKAMGMNPDEFVGSAKQQAKIQAFDQAWKAGNASSFNLAGQDEAMKSAIENKAQYSKESGWTVTYVNENGEDETVTMDKLTPEVMQNIMKDNKEPVEDIRQNVKKIASNLVSYKDRKQSLLDTIYTNNAQTIDPVMKTIDNIHTDAAQGVGIAGKIMDAISTGIMGSVAFIGGKMLLSGGKMIASKVGTSMRDGVADMLAGTSKNTRSIANGLPQNSFGSQGPSVPNGRGGSAGSNIGSRLRGGARNLRNIGKAAKFLKVGSILSVAAGAYTAYSGWQDADDELAANNETIGRMRVRNNNEREQLKMQAENKATREKSAAVGEGTGEAIGGIAGAALGSALGPIGTIVGGAAGAWLGGKIGKWAGEGVGGALTIAKEQEAIKKGSTEDNIKKIVLPIQSINYNVALIANQLGVVSAMPARGNTFLEAEAKGEMSVQTTEVQGSTVNPNNGAQNQPSTTYGSGQVTLNVNGSIELKANNQNVGNISAKEVAKMVQNDPSLRSAIINLVVNANNKSGNGGHRNGDTSNAIRNRI